jgi:uncharacterized repeat protein (TIGR03837 family)
MTGPATWDIFCKVVDNYGDAAVSWRLARQLAAEHARSVRLWIDNPAPLHALCPEVAVGVAAQSVQGVEIRAWPAGWREVRPARVAVEAFGCGLPDEYLSAMAQAPARSLWIVLEYLSAEPWVPQHHALPSPHPRWPVPRYFFFPGIEDGTGGLLREAGLLERRDAFNAEQQRQMWRSLGYEPPGDDSAVVSIFAYQNAPIERLLASWEASPVRMIAAVPPGPTVSRIAAHLAQPELRVGSRLIRGSLEVRALPFLPQPRYDELLWSCRSNFVRGEDSFVRAQWAGRPFVWHIYPQAEAAHWRKLDAFLERYVKNLPGSAAEALRALSYGWNGAADVKIDDAWNEYWAQRTVLMAHAAAWAAQRASAADLAANLVNYAAERLK